jgi:hypothetical protein
MLIKFEASGTETEAWPISLTVIKFLLCETIMYSVVPLHRHHTAEVEEGLKTNTPYIHNPGTGCSKSLAL